MDQGSALTVIYFISFTLSQLFHRVLERTSLDSVGKGFFLKKISPKYEMTKFHLNQNILFLLAY